MKSLLVILFSTVLLSPAFSQNLAKINSADKAFSNKKYQVALDIYESISTNSDSESYHYILFKKAYCHYYLSNHKKGIAYSKMAVKIKESNRLYNDIKGNAYWLLGRFYSQLEKKKKSLKCYIEGAKYIHDSKLYSTIAFKQIQLGKFKKALVNLNTAIELDKTNAYAFSNRALLHLKLSDLEKARKDINKAIQLDRQNPYAFKHSAMIYIELEEFDKACVELTKAEELGYADMGNESDSKDVEELMKKYCNAD